MQRKSHQVKHAKSVVWCGLRGGLKIFHPLPGRWRERVEIPPKLLCGVGCGGIEDLSSSARQVEETD